MSVNQDAHGESGCQIPVLLNQYGPVHPTHTMTKPSGWKARLIAVFVMIAAFPAVGQDFFRELGTSRTSGGLGPIVPSEYGYREAAPEGLTAVSPEVPEMPEDEFNIAFGPVRMSVAVGVGLEWNDNIALAEDNRESDFILRPLVNVDFMWPISENNSLRFSLGASWAKYLDHSEFDSSGLLISPTSELEFTFQVFALEVTLRERFSYQEEPYQYSTLSNVARYERYENQAGILFKWDVNEKLELRWGYDHYNLWSKNEDFSSNDHVIDTVFVRPSYELSPGFKVGIFGSYSWIKFDDSDRSDATNILVGPFFDWDITPYVNLYLEVGYQALNYDSTSNYANSLILDDENQELFDNLTDEQRELFDDTSSSDSLYFKLQLTHTPNDIFEHGLLASLTSEIGLGSNFYDLYHFEYGFTYKGIANMDFSPMLFYEYYETSGDFSEQAHRAGAAVGIRYHLSTSMTLGLDYRYLWKDSNFEGADYYQNLVFLSLYYRF